MILRQFYLRYKREVTSAHERISALERAKVQLDLDWQKRYDDLERQQYERSEDLVKKLTQARDEVVIVVFTPNDTVFLA